MATPRRRLGRLAAAVAAGTTGAALVVVAVLPVGADGGTRQEPAPARVTDAPTYAETAQPTRPTRPARTSTGTTLVIPRLDLRVPVVEGTDSEALARGVGHWANHTEPGDEGNYVLAGHRVTHGEPFADLPDLRPGDRVLVESGAYEYVYVMDTAGDGYRVDDADLWPVARMPRPMRGGPDRVLTLITCAETFHTDDRLVAFGHLESVRLLSAPSR